MRISDWSSDVCSSDLEAPREVPRHKPQNSDLGFSGTSSPCRQKWHKGLALSAALRCTAAQPKTHDSPPARTPSLRPPAPILRCIFLVVPSMPCRTFLIGH